MWRWDLKGVIVRALEIMMFSMRHRLWRMKFWGVWLATTGQGSLDNIFKYQNIFIVFSLCLSDLMLPKYGIQALLFKPIRSKPQVLTTFWFTWKRLFDNHASNWSFDMVLILYKHLENVQLVKPTLGYWPAEFCHFLTIFSPWSLRDSLWVLSSS